MIFGYTLIEVAIFFSVIIAALLIDLYTNRKDGVMSFTNAAVRSVIWVMLSLCFAVYVGVTHGTEKSFLFLSGYLIELSLSVDNLFVIMAIFSSFSIKNEYQHRVLYYGILGAIVFRMVFIAIGTSLLLLGKWVLALFGIFVLWTAWQMYRHADKDEKEIVDYNNHWSVKLSRRFFKTLPYSAGNKFFTREGGVLHITPLFLCLVVVEMADVMFAIDSVPAIIAITQEPFLVYTSNIFAILGLRSMYFLLAAAKRYLCHLEMAVVGILVFIGVKMLLDVFGVIHVSPNKSLIVVFVILTTGVIFSITHPKT
ncbi:MAG: TerC/Alx family metal homeostasis membrane protein [Nitrospirae bacterium]|nr:TerC/Alx family metal homeostasis membrane protein [Nitrospirota bacterium]